MTGFFGNKESYVGMRSRHVGITRMDHQRHAERLERAALEFRARGGCRGRQAGAAHVREIDPGLLEHVAALEHARPPTAATGAIPTVFAKRFAVFCSQRSIMIWIRLPTCSDSAVASKPISTEVPLTDTGGENVAV